MKELDNSDEKACGWCDYRFGCCEGVLGKNLNFEANKDKCYSGSWLNSDSTKFIIDGIELLKAKSLKSIACREKRFIARIKKIIERDRP